ncbi:tripartite tricarboxylate transporter substrate binding protein [Phreatobacter aquaticus]|uniref:Tripartite tricarboxylate transporter substrate binding protein n=1 Tax=Phreatobacter aquaticus TaxID=2570229 RepID=A0A4D7QDZ1_9HYPH|nr:tripartite tricarboxylate transporter substrate binding protein [Phreatobacter aquaticus]QCK86220.1 tripartite tricarboxylate transporter substrate binding protein [Phreatobacter aquaticus]
MPPHSRRTILAATAGLAAAHVLPARAQSFPDRRVTLIVPFPPGGPVDLTAREIGQKLSSYWNQPVIIENRPGADAVIGAQAVSKAAPDGYTMLVCAIHHSVHPSLKPNLPYNFLEDFLPISGAGIFPIIVCAHPSLPFQDIKGLIAHAKANPGKLSFGSAGMGGGTHLAGELFKSITGTDMLHVAHRGSAPAMASLLGNHVQLMFADGPTAVPQVEAKTVRALGISPARLPLLPDIPTMAEAGLPTFDAHSWSGIVVPKGTPADVVAKLNADVVRALKEPDTSERLLRFAAQPAPMSTEQFGAFLKAETAKWAAVIKAANIPMQQ